MDPQNQISSARDACTVLGIEHKAEYNDDFEIAGAVPNDLLSHTVSKQYVIIGMTPEEFVAKHGSTEFDINNLKKQFKTICKDYGDNLSLEDKSRAVEFCSKVIYEIGPDSRKGKKTEDKVWKLRFPYKDGSILKIATLFIATYRNSEFKPCYEPGKKLCVTVKQAGLLAMDTFNKLTLLAASASPAVYLLTPLAGAVYSRSDIDKIAEAISATPSAVLICINSSCQSGSQYLDESRLHIAIIAAIVATKNIKNENIKNGIIGKTIKQFLSVKKEWDPIKFEAFASYAHGGVPSDLQPELLIELFERIQKITPRQSVLASSQTVVQSTVSALPSGSHKSKK